MSFLTSVAAFLSREIMQRFGEDVLADGRRVFAEQLAKGLPQKEAARIAAQHMVRYAGQKGRDRATKAGKATAENVAKGAKLVREKITKQ